MSDKLTQADSRRKTAIVLEDFIGQLINQKSIEQKRSNQSDDISTARLSLLQFLATEGPKTLKQLAEYRNVTAATMSRLAASLVRDGYILMASSKKDKRSKIFIVTTFGRSVATKQRTTQLNKMIASIGQLSMEEQILLNKSIRLIKNVINLSSSNDQILKERE